MYLITEDMQLLSVMKAEGFLQYSRDLKSKRQLFCSFSTNSESYDQY